MLNFVQNKLPRLPSALIRLAVQHLQLIIDSDEYSIDMDSGWHEAGPTPEGGVCEVCFAGAVMVHGFNLDITRNVSSPNSLAVSNEMSNRDSDALLALDWFRQGHIVEGIDAMGLNIENADLPNYITIEDFENESPHFFIEEMLELATLMENQNF
jgi:hypothetical protein